MFLPGAEAHRARLRTELTDAWGIDSPCTRHGEVARMPAVRGRGRQRGGQGAAAAEPLLVALDSRLPIPSWPLVIRRAYDGNKDAALLLPAQCYVDWVSTLDVCNVATQ
jgi:hypothetical protein